MTKPTRTSRTASRRGRRLLLLLAALLSGTVAAASAGSIAMLRYIEESIPRVVVPELDDKSRFAEGPTNVLVLGSDSRDDLSEEDQERLGTPEDVGGQRADTLILVHLDPRRQKAVVLHMPRDLLVEIPGHGPNRINAALELGGPGLVVDTVKGFTGLPVHHYVQVDFLGFLGIVDAVRGVRVCLDRDVVDKVAGLDLRKGCRNLRGDRALSFVRARHVEGDLIPDFGRISRQQQFIRALLHKLLTVNTLLKPSLIREAAENVVTDAELSSTDILYLGNELRNLGDVAPGGSPSVDFRVIPAQPQDIDGVSYVVADEEQAKVLFRRLRAGRPLRQVGAVLYGTAPSPAVIRVAVVEVDAPTEEVEAVGRRLLRAGFAVVESGEIALEIEDSEILFPRGGRERAEVVAGYFPDLQLRRVAKDLLDGADAVVVIGPSGGGSR